MSKSRRYDVRELLSLVREHCKSVPAILEEIAKDTTAAARDRIAACNTLLAYGLGKAPALSANLTAPDSVDVLGADDGFTEYLAALTESDYERYAASGKNVKDIFREWASGRLRS